MYLSKQIVSSSAHHLLVMLEVSQGEVPEGRECKLVLSYLCASAPLPLSGWWDCCSPPMLSPALQCLGVFLEVIWAKRHARVNPFLCQVIYEWKAPLLPSFPHVSVNAISTSKGLKQQEWVFLSFSP